MENNEREITWKTCNPKLWFLCMTPQMGEVLSKYLKRFPNYRAEKIVMENDQREITGEISKPVLQILCMRLCLMELFKCMKVLSKYVKRFSSYRMVMICDGK